MPDHATASIHRSAWPVPDSTLQNDHAETIGNAMVAAATAVRRYKSEQNLPMGSEIERVQIASDDESIREGLQRAAAGLKSVTRAKVVEVTQTLDPALTPLEAEEGLSVALLSGEGAQATDSA